MDSIYQRYLGGYQQGQNNRAKQLAGDVIAGNADPQKFGELARLNPDTAIAAQKYQDAQHQQAITQAGKIAAFIASAPTPQARANAYNYALPKLKPITEFLGLPLPDQWDETHLPELQQVAQAWGGMQQPQQIAPRVVGNALVDASGKVLYQGPQAPPQPRLVQNENGEYVWVQPPPMPNAPQMAQQDSAQGDQMPAQDQPQADNPVMLQADQMARQLAAQGKTDAEIAPIVNDFIAKNYTPSGGVEMVPQPQSASGMMGGGVPTGVRGRASAQSDIERRIALAQKMGATPADIKAMVLGRTGDQAPADIPGNGTITGAQYLASLPKQQADQVKALAEGRMAFPSGTALKSPYWQQMLSAVAQYDPGFDAVNYNARAKTRSAFTSGKEAQIVNALNTVAEHLGQFSDNAAKLGNYSGLGPLTQLANRAKNAYLESSGDARIAAFNTNKKAVADEVAKVWRASGGSEADIQENLRNLDSAQSPEQLNAAIGTLTNLIYGKIAALQDQYTTGMGTTQTPRPLVSPEAKKAFDKTLQRMNGGNVAPASGGWSIQEVK